MADVPATLEPSLSAELTSLAYLWRVQRCDGAALGFTTHDRVIRYRGLDYVPSPGIAPAAVVERDGFDVEGSDVAGILSHASISATDIETGRYDAARAELLLIDWQAPERGAALLMSGELGEITVSDGRFEAEFRSAETQLERVPIELTSPECRARLGDARCQVDMAGRRTAAVVTEVFDDGRIRVSGVPQTQVYVYGTARALSGTAAGIDATVSAAAGDVLTLTDGPQLSVGDRLLLSEGCDRRWTTCRDRFANSVNFRGEPFVPGRDSVLRYPGL